MNLIASILKIADDRSFAVEIANALRTEINAFAKIDWTWDIENGFEYGAGKSEFVGLPNEFKYRGVNGGIMIHVSWDPQVRSQRPEVGSPRDIAWTSYGGSKALQGRIFKINVAVSIFPGSGNVRSFGFTKIDSYKVVLNAFEKVSFLPGQSFGQLKIELKDLIDRIALNPPMSMQTPEWKALKDEFALKNEDKLMIEKQRQQRQEINEGEKEFYGSVDVFEDFVIEENDGVFGNPDLQKLMKHTGKSRKELMVELNRRGLTFSPDMRSSLAFDIVGLSSAGLNLIAEKLDLAGLGRYARDLRSLASRLP